MKFNIKTPRGYVTGYKSSAMTVQTTSEKYRAEFAKIFSTQKAAAAFITKYADCGFGMQSKDCEIVSI
jgi:hypothetical protein